MPPYIQTITVGPLAVNCYLIGDPDTREAIIIDPGAEPEQIVAHVSDGDWIVNSVIITHAHFDHLLAAKRVVKTTGAPFLMHPQEVILLERVPEVALSWMGLKIDPPPPPDRLVTEGDTIDVGNFIYTVSETPGHSPGGICLVGEGEVFVGDTVFEGSIGRTDLPGADFETLMKSIEEKLLPLDGKMVLYTGHGPPTTLDHERKTNPFFLQHFR